MPPSKRTAARTAQAFLWTFRDSGDARARFATPNSRSHKPWRRESCSDRSSRPAKGLGFASHSHMAASTSVCVVTVATSKRTQASMAESPPASHTQILITRKFALMSSLDMMQAPASSLPCLLACLGCAAGESGKQRSASVASKAGLLNAPDRLPWLEDPLFQD